MVIWAPRSSESRWPLLAITLRKWRFEWWTTTGAKGRFIGVGPLYLRWGAA